MELKNVVALLQEFENNEEAKKYIIDGADKAIQVCLDEPSWLQDKYYFIDHANPVVANADISIPLLKLMAKLDKALQAYLQKPNGELAPSYAERLTENGYKTEAFVVTADNQHFGIMVQLKDAKYITH